MYTLKVRVDQWSMRQLWVGLSRVRFPWYTIFLKKNIVFIHFCFFISFLPFLCLPFPSSAFPFLPFPSLFLPFPSHSFPSLSFPFPSLPLSCGDVWKLGWNHCSWKYDVDHVAPTIRQSFKISLYRKLKVVSCVVVVYIKICWFTFQKSQWMSG